MEVIIMDWFKRKDSGLMPQEKKELPHGLWRKCDKCDEILYEKELERHLNVCWKCQFHFQVTSDLYFKILVDKGTFEELDSNLESKDFLNFKDKKKYNERIVEAQKKSNLKDAIVIGAANIMGNPVGLGVMDFRFIGGSMGSVVGEKVKRITEYARKNQRALILVSSTGGARMQEGLTSLMQMAKTSAYLAKFSKEGGLFISILTNPTTAGVLASFASLGDINIAEPGAHIGFAGPRVIKQTIGEDLPEGFQRAEFILEHGFVDMVVSRKDLKTTLDQILNFFNGHEKRPKTTHPPDK